MKNVGNQFNFASGAKEAAIGVGKVLGGTVVTAYGVCHALTCAFHLSTDIEAMRHGVTLFGEGVVSIVDGSAEMIKSFRDEPSKPQSIQP